jgi:hypothetical protein
LILPFQIYLATPWRQHTCGCTCRRWTRPWPSGSCSFSKNCKNDL